MKAEGAGPGQVEDADTIAIDFERSDGILRYEESREYCCTAVVNG